jgi:hypothetical protein
VARMTLGPLMVLGLPSKYGAKLRIWIKRGVCAHVQHPCKNSSLGSVCFHACSAAYIVFNAQLPAIN